MMLIMLILKDWRMFVVSLVSVLVACCPQLHGQRTVVVPQTAVAISTAVQPTKERREAVVEKILGVLATPITFHGKVIDHNGKPVPKARIGYSALDKFNESGSDFSNYADNNGNFWISGIHGAALTVTARKDGYYYIEGKSSQSFAYGYGGPGDKEPPTKENPAVLVLQKMEVTEPLLYFGTRDYKVTKDGRPMEMDLGTGREVPAGQGDIRFERWANDRAKDGKDHFDWRLRITVPKGGLVERQDQFAFEAPQEGYQEVAEIDMPASLGEKWQYTVSKSYFVKLPDGRYARINATIQAGHNNTPLILDSFVNPNSGSRNLEFDPAKVIKSL